ncbi:GNAT family N-acetyltransferase [Pedobacter sp. NJ-S-72]
MHADQELLADICQIKAIAWPYPIEAQQKWIAENLLSTDYHILLFDEGVLCAYMNLVNVEFILNGARKEGLGIGNVCAASTGKGYGGILMKEVNSYIKNRHALGILFCNSGLLEFYMKYNWTTVGKEKIAFPNIEKAQFETMVFNIDLPLESMVYADRLF